MLLLKKHLVLTKCNIFVKEMKNFQIDLLISLLKTLNSNRHLSFFKVVLEDCCDSVIMSGTSHECVLSSN